VSTLRSGDGSAGDVDYGSIGGSSTSYRQPDPARPERLLDDRAGLACSAWSVVDPDICTASVEYLRQDLASGPWDAHHGNLRTLPEYGGSLRLIVAV
jgi:hypothetical protein